MHSKVWQSLREGWYPSQLEASPLLKDYCSVFTVGLPERKVLPWLTSGSSTKFSDSGISIYKKISIAITIFSRMAWLRLRPENMLNSKQERNQGTMPLSCYHLQLRSDPALQERASSQTGWNRMVHTQSYAGGTSYQTCLQAILISCNRICGKPQYFLYWYLNQRTKM